MLERSVPTPFHQLSDLLPHTLLPLTLSVTLATTRQARYIPPQGLCTGCSICLGHALCREPQASLPQLLLRAWAPMQRPLLTTFKIPTCPHLHPATWLSSLPEHPSPSHLLRNPLTMLLSYYSSPETVSASQGPIPSTAVCVVPSTE